MAQAVLSPGSLWAEMLRDLRRLPERRLQRTDLLRPEFLLARQGRLSVYWIPFERLNPHARVVLVGLTPGYGQMEKAFTAARDAIRDGRSTAEALACIYERASFAGTMRVNMVRMLDAIGVADALGISSSAELFDRYGELVHTTSALRYPVFVGGKNYGGSNPQVRQSQLLKGYVRSLLAPELRAVPNALIVPLGRAVEQCIQLLVADGSVDEPRCLFGFPHPSGGNGHRVQQFRANEARMRHEMLVWASTLRGDETARSCRDEQKPGPEVRRLPAEGTACST